MKGLEEVGIRKAWNYALGKLWMIIFRLLVFSPFQIVWLRLLGARIGRNVILEHVRFFNLYRTGFKGLEIGNDCFIGHNGLIDLAGSVKIGNQVTFGPDCVILTHLNVGYNDHPLKSNFPAIVKPVYFESGCFVGARSIILPGVNVGTKSFVAAGSVVVENVASGTLIGGNPAKPIREIK